MDSTAIAKFTLAGITAVIALLVPFHLLTPEEATIIIKRYGLWLTLGTVSLFIFELRNPIKHIQLSSLRNLVRGHWMSFIVIIFATCFLHLHIDRGFKILYDEYTLSSTAMNMHMNQWASVQAASHQIDGEVISAVGFVDKRPLLFPFLIATTHQITGYRPENAFWVNSALTVLALYLLYSIVTSISTKRYGLFSILLLTSLPLLAQNTNGGGYELLNLCLIASLILCGIQYMKNEGTEGLNLLLLNSILLANTRYESVLYTLVPVMLWSIKGIRHRKIELTWFACFSPLLLISPLLSYSIFKANSGFIQTTENNFFSLHHLPENLEAAATYLFNIDGSDSNSIILSVIGLVSILLSAALIYRRIPSLRNHLPAILSAGCIIFANTFLALSCYWGAWTDPITSRFSLPLQFLFALFPCIAFYHIFKATKLHSIALAGCIAYIIFVSSPQNQLIQAEPRQMIATGNDWALKWINQHVPTNTNLIISDGCIGIQLYDYPAIPVILANQMPRHVANLTKTGFYDDIYVVQAYVGGNSLEEADTPPNATPLSKHYVLKPVAQKTFSSNSFYHISQIVGLQPSITEHSPSLKAAPPTLIPPKTDLSAYRDYLDRALPLVAE